MGDEYIIGPREGEPLPRPEEIERILTAMPEFFGRVQYPEDIAFEFRDAATLDKSVMPLMYAVISDESVVVCNQGYGHLHELIGRLCDHIASESAHEEARVTRP